MPAHASMGVVRERLLKGLTVVIALAAAGGFTFLRYQAYHGLDDESTVASRTVKAQFPSETVAVIGLAQFTGQGLETLVAARGADGAEQTAVFFVNGTVVGTDAQFVGPEGSSAAAPELSIGRYFVVLYKLFKPEDPNCCPTAGVSRVRYAWTGSAVKPSDPIPPRRCAETSAGR